MPQIAVTVPYGVTPGMTMKAKTPDGRAFLIPVPQGARPGMTLMVTIPDSPPGQKIETSDIGAEVMQQGTTMVEGVNTDDLVMVCAALCIICSCYPKFPDCLGAHAKAVITCDPRLVRANPTGALRPPSRCPTATQPCSTPRGVDASDESRAARRVSPLSPITRAVRARREAHHDRAKRTEPAP